MKRSQSFLWCASPVRIRKNILAAEVPALRTKGSQPHTRAPVLGRGVPTTYGCENLWAFHLDKTRAAVGSSVLLAQAQTHLLPNTNPKLQQRDK